jgi:hypothetical protein
MRDEARGIIAACVRQSNLVKEGKNTTTGMAYLFEK